jgi:3-methyl-2-oxobutanoate hydroxymethyltransferase
MERVTPQALIEMKRRGEKIATLTAYDFATAQMLDAAGIPLLLVGDSLGMVVLGHENTRRVTMTDMLHHVKAVARAKPRALVIADMPFRSYRTVTDALRNANRFLQAGADGVKLEGGEPVLEQIKALRAAAVPVMGHIGLLPQSVTNKAGFKIEGRTPVSAEQLLRDAALLEAAGVFAIVVECTVAEVARQITAAVSVPTIGIGAGPACDGQILVVNDMLGLFTEFVPKHVKQYAQLSAEMKRAFAQYKREVADGSFPGREHAFD